MFQLNLGLLVALLPHSHHIQDKIEDVQGGEEVVQGSIVSAPYHHPHQVHSGVEDEQGVYLLHYHPLQGGEEGAQGSVTGHRNLS